MQRLSDTHSIVYRSCSGTATSTSPWWYACGVYNQDMLALTIFAGIVTRVTQRERLLGQHVKNVRTNVFAVFVTLCSPNEDFGTSKNIRARRFVSSFHTPDYSIWAKRDEKSLQNVLPEYFSTFQNLRLGSIKLTVMSFSWLFMRWNVKISAFVVMGASYLRFSYHFLPMGESATFFARHNAWNRPVCDSASCLVIFWPRVTTTDIAHRPNRIGRCAIVHLVIFWPRVTTADIAHRPTAWNLPGIGRCAIVHLVLWFSGQELQQQISHTDQTESVGVR